MPDDLRVRKVLKQSDGVGERFVEGQNVGVTVLDEPPVKTVQNRVTQLVDDHIVRQAGEDGPAREVVARRIARGREVTEQDRLLHGVVVRVCFPEGVRVDAQAPDEFFVVKRSVRCAARRPEQRPPQRALEQADHLHANGVYHLLVELRVAVRRVDPMLLDHVRIVQIDRFVKTPGRRIEVNHLQVVADRSRRGAILATIQRGDDIQWELLPRDRHLHIPDGDRVQPRRQAGVGRVNPQPPMRRTRRMLGRIRHGSPHQWGTPAMRGLSHGTD